MPLARGEKLGAWALTEPNAGSDAAGTRTTAVRDGGDWVLNGTKTFITHGKSADVLVIMAATDRARGAKGISAFIVERGTPGLRAGRKEDKLGMRASETTEVILDQCRVPADQLLGEVGRGSSARCRCSTPAVSASRPCRSALRRAPSIARAAYAASRKQFGQPIASFQAIQWKLADMATRIEAARLLTYRAAFLKDRQQRTTLESAMAKLYASEVAVRAAEDAVQIHGGYGFVKDYPAEKFFRDVKLTTIGEGTSEIQRLVIARQLLG